MPDEVRLLGAFALALLTALATTPVAISVANRVAFHDHPAGYKAHHEPTPYLGGAVVVIAFVLAAGVTAAGSTRLVPLVLCAFAVWIVGTIDDRRTLSPGLRVAFEAVVAVVLFVTGLGWEVTGSAALDLLLTIAWVIALVNAFNLMDNMDGAATAVASVTAAAIGVLALVRGDTALAVLAFALAGACAGFLPYNLSSPARIFLGDGGSMPVGFLVAGLVMALPDDGQPAWAVLVTATLLVGLPVMDTSLVVFSRRRRRISVLAGGRDHLTHRLLPRLGSPRVVAASLAFAQALLAATAIATTEFGAGSVASAGILWFCAAALGVMALERRSWIPVEGVGAVQPATDSTNDGGGGRAPQRGPALKGVTLIEGLTVLTVTAVWGASPFLFGFYNLSWWGPIALAMFALLLGLVVARPATPRGAAMVAAGSLLFLGAWAFLSSEWAESSAQALIDASRWLLYAATFAILILLLRNDRLGKLILGATSGAVVGLVGYLLVKMLVGSGDSLFLNNRLNEPLGYVNGQAGYLLLALWPLVAVAERARNRLVAAAAVTGASLVVSVMLLTQTRAVVPAVALTAVLLVAVLPGRLRRLGVLAAVALGVLIASQSVLDVYDKALAAGAIRPDPDDISAAALACILGSLAAGVAWAALLAAYEALRSSHGEWVPRVRRGLGATIAALAAAAGVAAIIAIGNPVDRAENEWDAFVGLKGNAQGSRFTSGGGNRYDYWRVAVLEFRDRPVAGVGAGNYDVDYFRERRTTEDIRQPHSLLLQTLSELGLVGFAALLAFLGAIATGFVRRARAAHRAREDVGVVVAAGGVFAGWLIHASVDWTHLIPSVMGVVLCAAAVLVSPWQAVAPASGWPRRVVVAGVAAIALFGAWTVGRLTLAEHYRHQGRETLDTDPAHALDKAEDSLALNDASLPAHYLKAAAYARFNRPDDAVRTLRDAAALEPSDFVPWVLMGDLAVRQGRLGDAKTAYGKASALNPKDGELATLAADPAAALDD